MTGMNDLVTWLRAHLDDDERVAREAGGAPWMADIPRAVHVDASAIAENRLAWRTLGYVASVDREGDRQHIVRWDPARVLAELDAKRQILDVHQPDDVLDQPHCTTCGDWPTVPWPCPTVRLLALPLADWPGYRDEWRP